MKAAVAGVELAAVWSLVAVVELPAALGSPFTCPSAVGGVGLCAGCCIGVPVGFGSWLLATPALPHARGDPLHGFTHWSMRCSSPQ
jgi:hypothetical protein